MSQGSPSIETLVPSRTLGFMLMSAVIVAVALFLAQQRKQQDADGQIPALSLPASLLGFSAEHWYLPDDSALGFVHIPAGRFTMGSNPAVDPMAMEMNAGQPPADRVVRSCLLIMLPAMKQALRSLRLI